MHELKYAVVSANESWCIAKMHEGKIYQHYYNLNFDMAYLANQFYWDFIHD